MCLRVALHRMSTVAPPAGSINSAIVRTSPCFDACCVRLSRGGRSGVHELLKHICLFHGCFENVTNQNKRNRPKKRLHSSQPTNNLGPQPLRPALRVCCRCHRRHPLRPRAHPSNFELMRLFFCCVHAYAMHAQRTERRIHHRSASVESRS